MTHFLFATVTVLSLLYRVSPQLAVHLFIVVGGGGGGGGGVGVVVGLGCCFFFWGGGEGGGGVLFCFVFVWFFALFVKLH